MKAADRHLNAAGAKAAGDIHRMRKLVRLHADHGDQAAAAGLGDFAGDPFGPYARIGFVDRVDFHSDVFAEHAPRLAVQRQPVEHGERVGGNGRTDPLNHIAVIVVMRRLDQI